MNGWVAYFMFGSLWGLYVNSVLQLRYPKMGWLEIQWRSVLNIVFWPLSIIKSTLDNLLAYIVTPQEKEQTK